MDLLGKTVRNLIRKQHEDDVRTASSIATDLRTGGMDRAQSREMLFAAG
jgi:hypothetical protein